MRLIDADKLLALVKKNAPYIYHILMPIVALVPAANAQPARHGEWVDDRTSIICSECKAEYSDEIVFMNRNMDAEDLKFCPNCGARMEEEQDAD